MPCPTALGVLTVSARLAASALVLAAAAHAQSFEGVGAFTRPWALSGDGTTIVGSRTSPAGTEAFRWTAATGAEGLGDFAGDPLSSIAFAVSADGRVAAGRGALSPSRFHAARWTAGEGIADLGVLPSVRPIPSSDARGISGDGAVVVGLSDVGFDDGTSNGTRYQAFQWTLADGMTSLGWLQDLGPNAESVARGASADGTVVVGQSRSTRLPTCQVSFGCREAVRWENGEIEGLGVLGKTPNAGSDAVAVSADGAVVVGVSLDGAGSAESFRWTREDGMVGLGQLPSGVFGSEASDVSADGSVVVGLSDAEGGPVPYVWTEADGMRPLREVLADHGILVGAWQLDAVVGVSEDGRTFAGTGVNPGGDPEGWRAVLGPAVPAEPAPHAEPLSMRIAPTPTRGVARLALTVGATPNVTVTVVDLLGREVARLHDGPLGAGTHRLALDAARLPPGAYVVRATAGGRTVTHLTTVVR